MNIPAQPGFQDFQNQLKDLEEPALRQISLSPGEERRIGLRLRSEYLKDASRKKVRPIRHPRAESYLRELVLGLARHMRHRDRYPNLQITLLNAPIADGQALPGGFLLFTTGLLREPDEATVAGVVAHELAHLDLGHIHYYAKREALAQKPFPVAPGPDFQSVMNRSMAQFSQFMHPFRPEHEHQADCVAATWLYLDGYDPTALAALLERMDKQSSDADFLQFFSLFRSHPLALERKQAVLKRLDDLQQWQPRRDLATYPANLKALESRYAEPPPEPAPPKAKAEP